MMGKVLASISGAFPKGKAGVDKNNSSNLAGKRFLITQSSLHWLAGSEVVTLELAQYLQSQGCQVIVYTYLLADPIKKYFDDSQIKVIAANDAQLELTDFDYVWVHHQVLPASIIWQLGDNNRLKSVPRFIFHHMSSIEEIEGPYLGDLESKISSLSLFILHFVKQTWNQKINLAHITQKLFPNPAPVEYSQLNSHGAPNRMKQLLIVSNHLPNEVLEAVDILKRCGIEITLIGKTHNERLLDADFLKCFDVVLTIGKSAQYGLCAGIPVYVYDQYGGCGYLNEQNFQAASQRHFCGIGFGQKTAALIAQEITTGYLSACKFANKNRQQFIIQYSLDHILAKILPIKPRHINVLADSEIQQLLLNTFLIRKKVIDLHTALINQNKCQQENRLLRKQLAKLSRDHETVVMIDEYINDLRQQINTLRTDNVHKRQQKRSLENSLHDVTSSRFFRLWQALH